MCMSKLFTESGSLKICTALGKVHGYGKDKLQSCKSKVKAPDILSHRLSFNSSRYGCIVVQTLDVLVYISELRV